MTFQHGRKTAVSIAGTTLSVYVNTSEIEKNSDKHDVTTYGKDAHVYQGGLLDGAFTMSGVYDNTAVSGPRALLKPLVGTVVQLIHYPEGIGSGRPKDTLSVLIEKYKQSHPVADMITWQCDCQPSDSVDETPQP